MNVEVLAFLRRLSKATLALDGPGLSAQIANDAAGHRQLVRLLTAAAHLLLEATGGYERALVLGAHAAGPWRGQRHIHGGRAAPRAVLSMAALTAIVHNPILKAFYQNLRARGKLAKVALTAVMRKLILLLKNPNFAPA